MARTSSIYVCQQCGYQSPQFLGKCPQCQTWNSLVEEVEESKKSKVKGQKYGSSGRASVINLVDVQKEHYDRISTDIGEFDRVLGGGIVRGAVVLIAGDPGIGKSTLLTQLALNVNLSMQSKKKIATSSDGHRSPRNDIGGVLYISGEESAHQIKLRVERIKKNADLAVLNEVDVDVISEAISLTRPGLVIVDSIQTLVTGDLASVAGSVGQVRECANRLQRVAKANHIPVFIVGHVTKEGTVAGPKTLEHLVDVVLSLEGDPQSSYRILRGVKNRFGSTDEVGIFDMGSSGMTGVENPSRIFLESESHRVKAPGSVVAAIMTGLRPILVEIQALVTKSNLAIPRRIAQGIDNNRLVLLIAVLSKRLGLPLFDKDIFVNITGGIKVSEPACDLGVCMAVVSSLKEQLVKQGTVFIGEVGLLGELRNIRELSKRTKEAKKLGYTNVISPENAKSLDEVLKKVLE
ncbi:DNA repair protein RadA [Candidatus Daviesbacteria bacterium]|nr:DNA repair protein RadA [Candidatus Daviesbacteria bacterium]